MSLPRAPYSIASDGWLDNDLEGCNAWWLALVARLAVIFTASKLLLPHKLRLSACMKPLEIKTTSVNFKNQEQY